MTDPIPEPHVPPSIPIGAGGMRAAPGDGTTVQLVVERRRAAADGVAEFLLRDADGGELPDWTPGAHIDLVLEGNLIRQYSLCGRPGDRRTWRIAVLREPAGRGGSALIHERLTEGERVLARGPRNNFPFEPAPRCLFIAGGIGITPLLPMIAEAESAGARWQLLYGGRSRTSMAFVDELERYGRAAAIRPQDESGLLDLDTYLGRQTPETRVYCCGPGPLLSAVAERCAAWEPGALHLERFSPAAPPKDTAGETPFEVELARSHLILTVQPGSSILGTLLDAGLNPTYSCTEGVCGSCETNVLDGEVDHRDSVLTVDERAANESMMICVSRARSHRLVLDI